MKTKYLIWTLLIVSLVSCIGLCSYAYLTGLFETKNNPTGQSPIRTLSIQIDEAQHEKLFDQLKKFSEKYELDFDLTSYASETASIRFFVVMRAETFHIDAISYMGTSEVVFNFFVNDLTKPSSQEIVDELYNDLITFIINIPSIKINTN